MKGPIRPQEMVCETFMPQEHDQVEEQTRSCGKMANKCLNSDTSQKWKLSCYKTKAQTTVLPETI